MIAELIKERFGLSDLRRCPEIAPRYDRYGTECELFQWAHGGQHFCALVPLEWKAISYATPGPGFKTIYGTYKKLDQHKMIERLCKLIQRSIERGADEAL